MCLHLRAGDRARSEAGLWRSAIKLKIASLHHQTTASLAFCRSFLSFSLSRYLLFHQGVLNLPAGAPLLCMSRGCSLTPSSPSLFTLLAALSLFCCFQQDTSTTGIFCKLSRLISHSKLYYLISTEHAESCCHCRHACCLHTLPFPSQRFFSVFALGV